MPALTDRELLGGNVVILTTKGGRGSPRKVAAVVTVLIGAAVSGAAASPAAPASVAGHSGLSGSWASKIWMGAASAGTPATLADIRTMIGASSGQAATLTGAGIGIALIDTGVAAVPGLPAAQIVNGPDLSFESQSASLRYLDTYGHGTHMAGIIVGNDTATGTKGIAPKAKLTSIKVGTATGAVDVTQMMAALDWVVQHKNDDPANPIRVVNLSYGSGGTPPFWTDPVMFAAEQAWKAGIVVVAAAGNEAALQLSDPARDQFVIAVGSASTKGTLSAADDDISTFTNSGAGKRMDLLAPGESVVSLRDPGSNIDTAYPAARTGSTLFRGSGTSQATAVTAAAVALLLQARPALTPDQVKQILMYNGSILQAGNSAGKGYREINVNTALATATPTTAQTYTWSSGLGALEDARGPSHVVSDNIALTGENCIFGPFSTATWAPLSAAKKSWVGGVWLGHRMAGDGWTGSSWASKTWASGLWPGGSWAGTTTWIDPSWSSRFWSAGTWTAGSWTSRFWSSDDWASAYWG
jgi:serine protease AprX